MSGAQTQHDNEESAPALSKGRTRIVTFRVSSEEFGALTRASHSSGARSMSAFARAAALEKVHTLQTPPVSLSGDLTTLTKGLAQLDGVLQETSRKIRRMLGRAGADDGQEMSESGQT